MCRFPIYFRNLLVLPAGSMTDFTLRWLSAAANAGYEDFVQAGGNLLAPFWKEPIIL